MSLIAEGDIQQGCFFLTQGYVFALEEGLDSADRLHKILVKHGHDR